MDRSTRIAVVGGGLAGLTAAGLLQQAGFPVRVFEQAPDFSRIGAGIVLGANVGKVMRALGLEARFNRTGIRPDAFVSRRWDTGEAFYEFAFDEDRERRFGGAFVNIHRADLHALLQSPLQPGTVALGRHLVGVDERQDDVRLTFANGEIHVADIVIGADGLRSVLREGIADAAPPAYTGYMAPRAVIPKSRLPDVPIRDCTKWWGPDRHLMTYFMSPRRDELYVMGAPPSELWDGNPSPVVGSRADFVSAFGHFHSDLAQILDAIEEVTISPICDRPPDDRWHSRRIVLVGDACHPVRPFMAAGGSTAIEDAAVLSRCIQAFDDPEAAFKRYSEIRIPRLRVVQQISIENTWMRGPADTDWWYGYDATTVSLEPPPVDDPSPRVTLA